MSHLAVLGAGADQMPTYVEARRMGLRTIGFDVRQDAPAGALADEFFAIDVRDADAVLRILANRDIVGATCPAVDRAVPTLRVLSHALGIACGVTERAATCTVDKAAFRSLLAELGLPTYRSLELGAEQVTARAFGELDIAPPVMVKPIDSSGGKGVALVVDSNELPAALLTASACSSTGHVVVEDVVVGRHLSVEAFFNDPTPELMLVTERVHTGAPHMVTLAHRAPARLTVDEDVRIRGAVRSVAAALGIACGPLTVDVVVDHGGTPYLIEMAARLGGNGLPRLVRHALGVNTVRAAIDAAMARDIDVTPRWRRAAVLQILASDRSGVVTGVGIPDALTDHPDVAEVEVLPRRGDLVRAYDHAADKTGYLTVVGDPSEMQLDRLAQQLATLIALDVSAEDGTEMRCIWRFS